MDRKHDSKLEGIIRGLAFLGLNAVITIGVPFVKLYEFYSKSPRLYYESEKREE